MKGKPKTLTPKLRFPEFTGGPRWDERTIGVVCDLKAGDFVPASSICERLQDGLFPCYGGNGLRGYVGAFTHDGRYVLVGRQGALCGNVNLVTGKFHATEHALVVTPKRGIDTDWLYYALDFLKLNRFSIGQAQPGLSVGVLSEVSIAVPADKAEQRKIAACLTSLNEWIAAEGRKLEALRAHKKGLMQQLFPCEGETCPRLRFPEVRDAWDEGTLGALSASISSGRDKNSPDGSFALYGSTGVIGKASNGTFVGTFLLVARVGANAGLLTKVSGAFGVTDNTLVIDLMEKKNNDFIFHYLDNLGLNRMIFGSGQPLITGGQLKALPILLPGESEREGIAACLSSLDALIGAQSRKLDGLRSHKKGLMQQLFASLEGV